MASRSLFLSLRRRSSNCSLLGMLLSGASSIEYADHYPNNSETDDLKSRIFRLQLPKRSATTVIENWVGEGNQVSISDLRYISKDLGKSQRFKHAREVEKASSVVEELERQKVVLDIFTFDLWSSSCAAALNIDQVERFLDEMRCDSGCMVGRDTSTS